MSAPAPLVRGSLIITWKEDGTVDTITHEGRPITQIVNERLQSLTIQLNPLAMILPPELIDLIDLLLDCIAALPSTQRVQKISLADRIFEQLTVTYQDPQITLNPKLRSMFWKAILGHVWKWEDSHEKIHKGTPYYFMGEAFLALGDVPSAYTCFFNALEDDKENFVHIGKNLKDAPAYRTTSLVDNSQNNLYTSVVIPLRRTLQSYIDSYNQRASQNLTIQFIDRKFLQADPLEDIKRVFVATLHELYHLEQLHATRMINNDYSRLKVVGMLFNISLVIDQILAYLFLQNIPKRKRDMAKGIYQLVLQRKWINQTTDRDAGEFLSKVIPDLNGGPPDQIMPALLDGTATYDGRPLDIKIRSMLTTYHLRNYAGHNIEGNKILVERYEEILTTMLDAFFVSVESL